jgi:hypothetical protein
MNRPTESDTIDLLLAVTLEVAEAVLVLAIAVVALVLTVTRSRPAGSPARVMPAPAVHPLRELATELEQQPAATLRALAGTRSRRRTKAVLVAQLVAC